MMFLRQESQKDETRKHIAFDEFKDVLKERLRCCLLSPNLTGYVIGTASHVLVSPAVHANMNILYMDDTRSMQRRIQQLSRYQRKLFKTLRCWIPLRRWSKTCWRHSVPISSKRYVVNSPRELLIDRHHAKARKQYEVAEPHLAPCKDISARQSLWDHSQSLGAVCILGAYTYYSVLQLLIPDFFYCALPPFEQQ